MEGGKLSQDTNKELYTVWQSVGRSAQLPPPLLFHIQEADKIGKILRGLYVVEMEGRVAVPVPAGRI